jgi:ATP-binding cassette subfamily B protein
MVFGLGYVAAVVYTVTVVDASPGQVVLVLVIGTQLSQFVGAAVGELAFLRSIWLDISRRLMWLEDYAASVDARSDGVPPAQLTRGIRFDHVSFRYPGSDRLVLDDVSLDLPAGSVVAVVGDNGAGKTTLVKLLVGLYQPLSGQIVYNGIPGADIDLDALRAQIGFVTQDTQLFSGTIRENLLFVNPAASDAECLDVMRKAACDSLLARADRGLDTVIGEGGVKVSGGEKQRLSIARALLRNPHLLVFDEATSSLDSLTEEEISRTMRDVANSREVITILIAHRLSTVMHADRIYVLERGKIVEAGQHQDLLDRTGLYYAMWRQQVGERRSAPQLPTGKPAQLAPV